MVRTNSSVRQPLCLAIAGSRALGSMALRSVAPPVSGPDLVGVRAVLHRTACAVWPRRLWLTVRSAARSPAGGRRSPVPPSTTAPRISGHVLVQRRGSVASTPRWAHDASCNSTIFPARLRRLSAETAWARPRARGGRPDNAQNGPVTLPVCSGLHTSESASPSVAGASNPLER